MEKLKCYNFIITNATGGQFSMKYFAKNEKEALKYLANDDMVEEGDTIVVEIEE